ncbi:hypothetical protein [Streptomyces africanus]|uniref:hypothetical protein n=1 Tax=Streptomyces africanus TaxID=231024 RepID=UPI000A39CE8F|nr:hypothetical protein [Streptomyces africanus]
MAELRTGWVAPCVPESIHGAVTAGQAEAEHSLPQPSMKSFHSKITGARLYANALERSLQ